MVISSSVRRQGDHVTAKFERLAEAIRLQIRSGELAPGDRLPSTERLKKLHGVSYSTIRSAMLVLKAEGWVVGVPGEAVYVAPNPPI
jgi:GntR family transcriptional regulator